MLLPLKCLAKRLGGGGGGVPSVYFSICRQYCAHIANKIIIKVLVSSLILVKII